MMDVLASRPSPGDRLIFFKSIENDVSTVIPWEPPLVISAPLPFSVGKIQLALCNCAFFTNLHLFYFSKPEPLCSGPLHLPFLTKYHGIIPTV
mmetsp:Transcript_28640/g.47384  ORF Transcript_28640/g.47384 Transcript_28640/m.47384 type:complete len:93 (-) Transcript_28640:1915-2193(-)